MNKYLLLIVLILTVTACQSSDNNKVTATVGDVTIIESDLAHTIEIENVYGVEIGEAEALLILVDDAIEIEVGKKLGVPATKDQTEDLRKEMSSSKIEAELFNATKKVFGDDSASYNRLYLSPIVQNINIRKLYKKDKSINAKPIKLIKEVKLLVDKGNTLESTADKTNTEYKKYNIGKTDNKNKSNMPKELQKYMKEEKKNKLQDPLIKVVKNIKEGEVFHNIVETDDSYIVIRLIKENGEIFTIETITTMKKNINKWYRGNAKDIKINIANQPLKDTLIEQYPDTWWLSNL